MITMKMRLDDEAHFLVMIYTSINPPTKERTIAMIASD